MAAHFKQTVLIHRRDHKVLQGDGTTLCCHRQWQALWTICESLDCWDAAEDTVCVFSPLTGGTLPRNSLCGTAGWSQHTVLNWDAAACADTPLQTKQGQPKLFAIIGLLGEIRYWPVTVVSLQFDGESSLSAAGLLDTYSMERNHFIVLMVTELSLITVNIWYIEAAAILH